MRSTTQRNDSITSPAEISIHEKLYLVTRVRRMATTAAKSCSTHVMTRKTK